jgi:hypothetical protein
MKNLWYLKSKFLTWTVFLLSSSYDNEFSKYQHDQKKNTSDTMSIVIEFIANITFKIKIWI